MKNKLQCATALSILALSSAALSAQAPDVCPPVELVKQHANFSQAKLEGEDIWSMIDLTPYQFNGQNWFTAVIANLPGITDEEKAYEGAREMLDRTQLVMPKPGDPCIYAFSIVPIFGVAAIPQSDMDSDYKTRLLSYLHRK